MMESPHRRDVLLVADDLADEIATLREPLEKAGYEVVGATSASETTRILETRFVDLMLLDERLGSRSGTKLLEACRDKYPGLGGIIITGYADLPCAIGAMRAGARDLLQKPIDKESLLESVSRALADTRLARESRYDRWRAAQGGAFGEIVGESAALQQALELLHQVAATTAPVVLQGESGTGKELAARAIHAAGSRRNKQFIAINAGAIPATLMESTLFGSKKGSYTNATEDTRGVFEAAHGGTLFLDEIAETTPDIQVRLLRVLQEKSVTRVGDVEPKKADARVIVASNRDLRAEVDAKRFRSDLYFRLAVVTITLPPLRERLSDIERLSRHILEKHSRALGRSVIDFAPASFDKLRRYPWPGNIRELDNVIQRAVILAKDNVIGPDQLVLEPARGSSRDVDALLDLKYRDALSSFEKLYFGRLLVQTNNNKTKAAERAGIDRTVLHAHLRKTHAEPDPD